MELLLVFLLILINGILAMSEIAVISSRKSKLEINAQKGHSSAKKVIELQENPSHFLSTIQIGLTIIGILIGILSESKIAGTLESYVAKIELLRRFSNEIATIIIIIPVTFFTLVLGELIPKRIGLLNPETIASVMVKPIMILSKISHPFIWLLQKSTDYIIALLNIKPTINSNLLEEEIKSLVEEGTTSGSIQEIEQDLVENVFKVGDRKINSLMRHYSEVVSICSDCSVEDLRTIFKQYPHSAYPVIDAKSSDILGVAHMKDILYTLFTEDTQFSIAKTTLPVHFIPENSSVYTVLEKFRTTKIHFAIILNEYGLVTGIVTINDILDAIIGDLDSTDGKATIVPKDENSWYIDARISFEDFCNYFDINSMYVENKGFTSLGGLVFDLLKHIPEIGEKISWREFEFEVVAMDGMRIDKIIASKMSF